MANFAVNPDAVHAPAGIYSHSVLVPDGSRVAYLAGQVGMDPDGNVPPDFADQADQAFRNVSAILEHHSLTMSDVVKMTHYLTNPDYVAAYGEVRSRWLGEARPASTVVIVSGLARPDLKVEIDVVAAAAP